MDIAVRDESPNASILRAAAGGEEWACARLVADHHGAMSRAAFVVAGDVDIAQEAVQVAWSIAWRQLSSVRDPERLRAWLVAIAANEARRLIKRRGRRTVVELSMVSDAAVSDAASLPDPEEHIELVDLRRALGTLSPDERTLLAMRYAAGLDSTQIGQQLGMSSSGVRSRLTRLVERLRRELVDA
jgi:RNA polymerase sigma-70 factor (ECF subfamily)